MLTTNNIVIEKHARVFSFGAINTAEEVWLLFHGYGQNIPEFFEPFKAFSAEKTFVVPEGLSRFYQKGIFGKVGASWMTSEERESEIQDQFTFLNKVYKEYNLENKKLNVFAFSQGAPTAARWIEAFNINTNRLIFWSGNIPEEIAKDENNWINKQSPEFYIGKQDQFATLDIWMKFFNQHKHYTPLLYDGDHYFTKDLLKKVFSNL